MVIMADQQIQEVYKAVGQNIRRAREVSNLTQEALGSKVNLSRTSINNIENARQKFLVHTLFDIAQACRVKPESLLTQEGGRPFVPADLEDWVSRVETAADNQQG